MLGNRIVFKEVLDCSFMSFFKKEEKLEKGKGNRKIKRFRQQVDSKRSERRDENGSSSIAATETKLVTLLGERGFETDGRNLFYKGRGVNYWIIGQGQISVSAGGLEKDFYMGSQGFPRDLKDFLRDAGYGSEAV